MTRHPIGLPHLPLLLLLALPTVAHAQFNYTTNSGAITITKYTGPGGAVTIPSSINGLPVTTIGAYAFSSYGTLTKVTIPDSVTTIEYNAFYECANLTSVVLPNSVTSIGDAAFAFCSSLTNVVLPNSVTSIGFYAYNSCRNLTNITIGNGVSSIGDFALDNCPKLTSITVATLNPWYSSVEGILFDKSTNTLIRCPQGKGGSYTIPPSVNYIQGWAFSLCISLSSVTVPASVINMEWYVFADCTRLTAVYFQGNALTVGGDIFSGATIVTVYYLPGTSGWGPTYGGRPTMLWNPQVQTSAPDFGVGPNGFGFNITGTPGIPIVVEASTGLASGAWIPLQNCTLTNGFVYFADPQWANYLNRFYRIRWP